MALDLSKVKERDALRSQREPYWQRIRPGCFLGYRPSAREGAGTWIARAYDEDQRRYSLKALGDFGTLPGKDRFAEAKKEAEKDEPDSVKLKALLADAGEMVRTFTILDPAWQAVQRVAKMFGML